MKAPVEPRGDECGPILNLLWMADSDIPGTGKVLFTEALQQKARAAVAEPGRAGQAAARLPDRRQARKRVNDIVDLTALMCPWGCQTGRRVRPGRNR